MSERAQAIIALGRTMGMDDDTIIDRTQGALDDWVLSNPNASDALGLLLRASFAGDDDYDELRHELLHALGECSDDDPDCVWLDPDDESE